MEQLRDDYPLAYILSVAVAPFGLGETPLQHYNTLLCLSWQQTYSDAVLLFQNDYVLQQAQKSTRAEKGAGRHSSEDVSVSEMNRQISQTLCNSFLPIWSAKQRWVLAATYNTQACMNNQWTALKKGKRRYYTRCTHYKGCISMQLIVAT